MMASRTDAATLLIDRRELPALRRALVQWSAAHHRELPWRNIGDPYRVWISEVMLQQTTVAAVIPYYERFLQRFPDVQSLAAADESDVLRLWEGLGYYSRARNLHNGAKELVFQRSGEFPRDVGALQSLPGIGRYTAGAIASFAFDERAPIVEANTLRLYSRLLGFDGDPRSAAGQEILWNFAEAILPKRHPGQFNQALMDLGATVCTPAEPKCPACPLKRYCRALRDDKVAEVPRSAKRQAITEVKAYAIAIRHKYEYLLRRCPPKERWAGLWDFPRFESEEEFPSPAALERRLAEWVRELTGLQISLGDQVSEFRHGVTRFRITLGCFTAEFASGRLKSGSEWAWVSPEKMSTYPLSVTGRKFADRLRNRLF
jgi:A/G-specific adenine glycosylase